MRLTINGREFSIASVADAQTHWDTARRQQFSDIWLEVNKDGPALTALINHRRVMLMYMPDYDGDPGYTSRNLDSAELPHAEIVFELANGQRDHYPLAWTIPLDDALAACEYFAETQGGRSSAIVWQWSGDA